MTGSDQRIIGVQGIKPVWRPFTAFLIYLLAVSWVCIFLSLLFSKIYQTVDLFYIWTDKEYFSFGLSLLYSTLIMLAIFFISASYSTIDECVTKRHVQTGLKLQRIINIIQSSCLSTWLVFILYYILLTVFFYILLNWNDLLFYNGISGASLDMVKIFTSFADFSFIFFHLIVASCVYFFALCFTMSSNLSFFLLPIIEPINKNFWQKVKSISNR